MVVSSSKRKRTSSYKRSVRRKRNTFRGAGSGAIPRGISSLAGQTGIVSITRSVEVINSVQGAATDSLLGFSFQLSDLPGYTAFTSLYDQYRFIAVKCEYVPVNIPTTTNIAGVLTATPTPVLHTCIDLDDANTPTAAVVLSHQTYKCHGAYSPTCNAKYVRWFEPAVAMDAYQGAFGGFASKSKQWIDSASPAVQHYGLKHWIEMPTGSSATRIQMYATFYMQFRLPF